MAAGWQSNWHVARVSDPCSEANSRSPSIVDIRVSRGPRSSSGLWEKYRISNAQYRMSKRRKIFVLGSTGRIPAPRESAPYSSGRQGTSFRA